MTGQPTDPLATVDPSAADPDLADAPPAVRRADAWLKSTQRVRLVAAAAGIVGLFAPLATGALLHDLGFAGEAASGAMILGGVGLWGVYVAWVARQWGSTTAYASKLITRYKELRELGAASEEPPRSDGPVERMVARIQALAGDRADVRDAAIRLGDRARRIESELAHLASAATGDPRADAALDAARDRLRSELDHTRATVAETYAALAELGAGPDPAVGLEEVVGRLAAEVEVERLAARRAAARRQAQ